MISRISFIILFSVSFFMMNSSSADASLAPADSLRIKWMNGQKFILHKVEPRETWTQLAKRYNCSVNELMEANHGVEMLKIDQIVHIPVNTQGVAAAPSGESRPAESVKAVVNDSQKPKTSTVQPTQTPVIHTVKPGETLFAIARKFEQPVETIKGYNNMTADGIQVGQKLIVKYVSSSGNQLISKTESQVVVVPPTKPAEGTALASAVATESSEIKSTKDVQPAAKADAAVKDDPKVENYFDKATKTVTTVKKGNSGKSMLQVAETGVATLFKDGSMNQNKYYGLHRTAPIGTIVKVTNRMNNQFVYVKIVGVLPDTGENDNVIIKMSQAVSDKLNTLDTFFQVELSYGLME